LGRLGDPRTVSSLLEVVGNLDNATDACHAAAEALGRLARATDLAALRRLAAD